MLHCPHPQAGKLHQLIRAALAGRNDAESGRLFVGRPGLALVNAAFDLFECDALYDLAADVRSELGLDIDDAPLDREGERSFGRSAST